MAGQTTLFDAVEQFIAMRQATCAPTTAYNDASVLRRFAKSVGDIQVRHLKETHVERWFFGDRGLRLTVKEPSSYNNYRKRLNAFFTFCARKGWLRTDPLMNVKVRPVMRRERLRLSPRQLLALLNLAPNPRDRVYLAVNLNTGLRANEIVGLRLGDVDLDAGELRVTITKTAEQDMMPITSDLDRELRRWLVQYESDLGQPLTKAMFLIPAATGPRYTYTPDATGRKTRATVPSEWKPFTPVQHPAQIVQDALRKMNIPTRGEGSHTIRRSIARIFFDMESERGYDSALRATSALLHHKDSATTEAYLGLTKERKRRDETLRGQPFLTALAANENVVPLRSAESR